MDAVSDDLRERFKGNMTVGAGPVPGTVFSNHCFHRRELPFQMICREGGLMIFCEEISIIVAPLRSCPIEALFDITVGLDMHELDLWITFE
jgi:hypothetical protein